MEPLFLGIDIGTHSSKGLVVDAAGEAIAESEIGHALSLPEPGWAEHDAEAVWWGDVRKLSRDLTSKLGDDARRIAAVGCSAIAPAVLPLDADGAPLRPAILYGIDVRADDEVRQLSSAFGDEIRRRGGTTLSSQSAGPKILWLARHEPDVFARTAMFASATTYVGYKLTGEYALDRYTAAAFAPLFDVRELAWSANFAREICSLEQLPELHWATDVVGRVTPAAALETGLPPRTPVIAGTADAAAEVVGAGAHAVGDLVLMYGSSGFFILQTDHVLDDARLWPSVWLEPGRAVLAAGSSVSGALLTWFAQEFGEPYDDAVGALEGLSRSAAQVPPGSEGLLVLPYFSGERTPLMDPDARGVIAGLTLRHGKPHIFRAFLEATAYAIRHNVEAMLATAAPVERVFAVGGGTRNPLWLQIVSDVTGLEQAVPARRGGAALGDAFMAAVGIGAMRGLDAIRSWVDSYDRVHPRRELRPTYDGYFATYRELYQQAAPQLHRLARYGRGWQEPRDRRD